VLPTQEQQAAAAPAAANPHTVLQMAMRIGDILLAAGMSANDAVLYVLRITRAYGLTGVHVDVTFTAMTASYYPGPGQAPITSIRVVRPVEVDYTRVRRVERLVGNIVRRGMPVAEAAAALEKIRSGPHPYPRFLAMVGNAGLATAVSLIFTTNWKILVLTFLTGCIVDLLLRGFDRRDFPPFFRNLMAAGIVTLIAAGITFASTEGVDYLEGLDSTLIVVGGIIMLLAGTMVVGAVQDAIDQFYVTASARMFEVFMRTAGIVAGIVVGLAVAQQLGISMTISTEPLARGPLWAQFVGAGLLAAFYALSVYADFVTMILSGAMALVSLASYLGALRLNFEAVPANTVAALVAAVITTLIVRRTHVPGFAVVTASLLPLVPGLAIYQGLLQIVGPEPRLGDPQTGAGTLALALGVAISIGAGASLGIFLGRPLVDTVRRITVRRKEVSPNST